MLARAFVPETRRTGSEKYFLYASAAGLEILTVNPGILVTSGNTVQ